MVFLKPTTDAMSAQKAVPTSQVCSPSHIPTCTHLRQTLDIVLAIKMSSNSSEPSRSTTSKYTITSTLNSDPKVHPDANVIHHYTHCAHTSPPENRPLNVQPTLIHSSSTSEGPKSTLLGRCYNCDLEYGRQLETSVLRKYHKLSHTLQLQLIAAREGLQTVDANNQIDEDCIDKIVSETDDLVGKREADVKSIWKGFSRRWGPGTVSIQPGVNGGRVDVKWERPEKKRA